MRSEAVAKEYRVRSPFERSMGDVDFSRAFSGQTIDGAFAAGCCCREVSSNESRLAKFGKTDVGTADGVESRQLFDLPPVEEPE